MVDSQKFRVTINLYDLSQGMARQMSKPLLGKQLDGIWHTGIVVYNEEFFYSGGICRGISKQTPFGMPMKEIYLGDSNKSKQTFLNFLQTISHKFQMETYDLFKNNCNNFTDECCKFLLGFGIPELN